MLDPVCRMGLRSRVRVLNLEFDGYLHSSV
jgi:hypothetical protein